MQPQRGYVASHGSLPSLVIHSSSIFFLNGDGNLDCRIPTLTPLHSFASFLYVDIARSIVLQTNNTAPPSKAKTPAIFIAFCELSNTTLIIFVFWDSDAIAFD